MPVAQFTLSVGGGCAPLLRRAGSGEPAAPRPRSLLREQARYALSSGATPRMRGASRGEQGPSDSSRTSERRGSARAQGLTATLRPRPRRGAHADRGGRIPGRQPRAHPPDRARRPGQTAPYAHAAARSHRIPRRLKTLCVGGACGPVTLCVGGACGPVTLRVGGACGPPPPFAAPLASSLRALFRGDPPRTC